MKKRFKHKDFYLAFFVFILSACGQSLDCFREDVFCAGLVTDTLGINDQGINQDTWAGMQEALSTGLVDQAEYIESVDTRDYEKNINYFAQNGFDVIVTTGVGMSDETQHSADLYLDSVFIGINQFHEVARPNLISIIFAEDQMGFIAGALAARISETKIIGAVCETSGIDSMWRYCEGFRAGAKFVDEQIKIQVIYREDGDREKLFIDETWGYETGQKLIQRGVDVIFAAGGVTGQGVLRAAAETHTSAIGAERNQGAVLGESGLSVVTSVFGDASFEVQKMMRMIRDGNVNQAESGQIKYVALNQKFPESFKKDMNFWLLQLQNGEIRTGVSVEKP